MMSRSCPKPFQAFRPAVGVSTTRLSQRGFIELATEDITDTARAYDWGKMMTGTITHTLPLIAPDAYHLVLINGFIAEPTPEVWLAHRNDYLTTTIAQVLSNNATSLTLRALKTPKNSTVNPCFFWILSAAQQGEAYPTVHYVAYSEVQQQYLQTIRG